MGQMSAYVSSAYWRDIGTPRSYLAASNDVLAGAVGRGESFKHLSVDRSVRISKDVSLLPPVSIAGGCEIGAGATIGGRTSMGEGCLVGEGAIVEGSILFDGAEVGEGTIVRNSIVGPERPYTRTVSSGVGPCLGQVASWKKETCWIAEPV
jgi:mannose-1-phosphate guanylyltransferase